MDLMSCTSLSGSFVCTRVKRKGMYRSRDFCGSCRLPGFHCMARAGPMMLGKNVTVKPGVGAGNGKTWTISHHGWIDLVATRLALFPMRSKRSKVYRRRRNKTKSPRRNTVSQESGPYDGTPASTPRRRWLPRIFLILQLHRSRGCNCKIRYIRLSAYQMQVLGSERIISYGFK